MFELMSRLFGTAVSLSASAMLLQTVAQKFIPDWVYNYLYLYFRILLSYFFNQFDMVIEEYDNNGLVNNEIYDAAEVYLASKVSPYTRSLKVSKPEKEKSITVRMDERQGVTDVFKGVKFQWVLISRRINNTAPVVISSSTAVRPQSTSRYFSLTFDMKHKDMVLESYLPHVLEEAKVIKEKTKTHKIFTIDLNNGLYGDGDIWTSVNLDHPATFDTLAIDSNLKETIMKDLERFVRRKQFYRKVGKAWKRGYLLYGPPGTGKSSLIASMANYLKFDIYDMELTQIPDNSYLRSILLATANRSVLVIEDIDCSLAFHNRVVNNGHQSSHGGKEKKVTLSGFLNFIDGLWSSIGDERIIVFTTNHKEKIDPALIRPGRMDMHIHMSYCTPCGFKTLANNYLGIQYHHLFKEIEEIIAEAKVSPAQVAEELMKGEDPERVLTELIQFLHNKKIDDEAKAKEVAEEAENKAQDASKKDVDGQKKQKKDEG